ncbi:Ankyrin repeat-containing protein [Beauveria bassiana ARSEF 2860]|uniref:Ankyrin repeat-containing protein n=1 Tax=Beauveria bassiana (strain ARSEF 2860) TaxID=655819 RepID=J4KLJ0_BEAB2|nr:Ankyrin repeat-containing protein [Beauveria bassiana ARSEF 2860]EJP62289.1 Ankyrin repeat-containing protein [Beauveria bassiana ARSEF 2860]
MCHMIATAEIYGEEVEGKLEPESEPGFPEDDVLLSTLDGSDDAPNSAPWFVSLTSGTKTNSNASSDLDVGADSDEQQSRNSEIMLKMAMENVEDILDQVLMLGFAIRKSGTTARLEKADSSFNSDDNRQLRTYLEFMTGTARQRIVEDNNATASQRMEEANGRLGAVTPEQQHLILANLRRRHRFEYARRHQRKLDRAIVPPVIPISEPAMHTPGQRSILPESKAEFLADPMPPMNESRSITQPLPLPRVILGVQGMSDTTPSKAEGSILKLAVPSQAAGSRVSVSVAKMHYPSAPKADGMRGFKCPCCFQTLPIMFRDRSRWRKHLTEDLCPYTCPFLQCPRPNTLYVSRTAWRDHIQESHSAGQYWECLACAGTEAPNVFFTAEQFASHNQLQHQDTISNEQIEYLQTSCRKIKLPNIPQCPLCSWPQGEDAVPDADANLEHLGNCIHEFSLNALPWADSSDVGFAGLRDLEFRQRIEQWVEGARESASTIEGVDIRKISIDTFGVLPVPSQPESSKMTFIPEEYFAESSEVSIRIEQDSDLPDVRGMYSKVDVDASVEHDQRLKPFQMCLKSLAFSEMDQWATETEKATEGTCRWIFQHRAYQAWDTCDQGMLLIKGMTGAGKSTLLRYVLENTLLSNTGGSAVVLSFFFHAHGSKLQRTMLGLFRSLLHQLLLQVPDVLSDLITLQQWSNALGKHGENWQWHLSELQEHFHLSLSKVLESHPIWLFVDALDECGHANAVGLVNYFDTILPEFRHTGLQFHVCFTSHHMRPDITSVFEINLVRENAQDISIHLQSQVSALPGTDIPAGIVADITSRAHGSFLWACLLMGHVIDRKQKGDSLRRIEEKIRAIPYELEQLYLYLFLGQDKKPAFIKLSQWMCFATRPLTLDELRWALIGHVNGLHMPYPARWSKAGFEHGLDEIGLNSVSSGLVKVVRSFDTRVVRFIHSSAHDFFTSDYLSNISGNMPAEFIKPGVSVAASAHYELSRTCVRYLTMDDIIRTTIHDRGDLISTFPLLHYATTSWLLHAKQSEKMGLTQDDLLDYFMWPSEDLLQQWADQLGIDIDVKDTLGRTSLILASKNGHETAVELLLAAGADVQAVDGQGQTPLSWAAKSGHERVAKLLLNARAYIDCADSLGETPLSYAARSGPAFVKLLVDEKASRDIRRREEDYIKMIETYVKDTPKLGEFFHGKDHFIRNMAKKVLDLADDLTTDLGTTDVLPKIIKVTMHQHVIYCDDSRSMRRNTQWENQKSLALSIARTVTRILPDGEGVALRFINHRINEAPSLDLEGVARVLQSVEPRGATPIGTSLQDCILEPLVFQPLASGKLSRPLLVSIFTDGIPHSENKNTLASVIINCGKILVKNNYPLNYVNFLIGQIGSSVNVHEFLGTLRENPDVARVSRIFAGSIDDKFQSFDDERSLDRWLVEILFGPLVDIEI